MNENMNAVNERADYLRSIIRGNVLEASVEFASSMEKIQQFQNEALAFERLRILNDRVRDVVRKLEPESATSVDDLREAVNQIAEVLEVRNPFLDDISDLIDDYSNVYGALDELLYAVQSAQSALDNILGEMYSYQEGMDNLDKSRDDWIEDYESFENDWYSVLEFAKNYY